MATCAPVLQLRKIAGGGLVTTYLDSFDRIPSEEERHASAELSVTLQWARAIKGEWWWIVKICGGRRTARCCPRSPAMMERRSRNTEENAQFSRVIAAPKSGERWLLVTSAFHMPRSVGLIRKAGFAVEPYPVDWRVGTSADLVSFRKYAIDGLTNADVGVREWMGLAAYRLAGKTSEFLPDWGPT